MKKSVVRCISSTRGRIGTGGNDSRSVTSLASTSSFNTKSQHPSREQPFTASQAAMFARRGASVIAFPPDEEFRLPVLPDAPASTSLTATKVKATETNRDEMMGTAAFTASDAAEFSRRGASMVAFPTED